VPAEHFRQESSHWQSNSEIEIKNGSHTDAFKKLLQYLDSPAIFHIRKYSRFTLRYVIYLNFSRNHKHKLNPSQAMIELQLAAEGGICHVNSNLFKN